MYTPYSGKFLKIQIFKNKTFRNYLFKNLVHPVIFTTECETFRFTFLKISENQSLQKFPTVR